MGGSGTALCCWDQALHKGVGPKIEEHARENVLQSKNVCYIAGYIGIT